MKKLVYGSVCSGIEAATVAWHPLGWEPSFFSEIEPFPRAVLNHHYPETPCHGDFTTIQPNEYRPIDLLVGGTPCQAFSVAGLRKGLDDPRGNLSLAFLALAERLRPKWVVWENVPGVLSIDRGRTFGAFLAGLGQVGYGFAYRIFDAQYFGVAQRRRRVFVIGHLGDWRPAAAVLFERESLSRNPAPCRKAKQRASGGPTGCPPVSGTLDRGIPGRGAGNAVGYTDHLIPEQVAETLMASDYKGPGHNRDHNFVPVATAFSVREDAKADTFSATPLEVSTALKAQQASPQSHHAQTFVVDQPPVSFQTKQQGLDTAEDIAGTLCANDYKEPQAVAYNLAGSSKRDFSVNETEVSHCLGTGIPAFHEQCQNSVTQIVQSVSFEPGIAAREGGHIYEEISGTLRSNAGDNQMAVAVDAYNQTINQETSQTLGSSATDINHTGGVINPAVKMAVRRLTPTECERLQGFPDGYTAIPWRKKPASECPDGPRYKVLGNSMAVPVMRWIGERIALFESLDLPK